MININTCFGEGEICENTFRIYVWCAVYEDRLFFLIDVLDVVKRLWGDSWFFSGTFSRILRFIQHKNYLWQQVAMSGTASPTYPFFPFFDWKKLVMNHPATVRQKSQILSMGCHFLLAGRWFCGWWSPLIFCWLASRKPRPTSSMTQGPKLVWRSHLALFTCHSLFLLGIQLLSQETAAICDIMIITGISSEIFIEYEQNGNRYLTINIPMIIFY